MQSRKYLTKIRFISNLKQLFFKEIGRAEYEYMEEMTQRSMVFKANKYSIVGTNQNV